MQSRWHHRPFLHSPALGLEKRATWLELFYDLVFVAAFIQLGNGLADRVSVPGFAAFAAVFVPLWIAWTGFTFFENRFTVDDFAHRSMVLGQMFAVGAMAIAAPGVLAGHTAAFSLAAAAAQAVVAGMYARGYVQVPESRNYCAYWGGAFGASALVWLAAAVVPRPYCFWMWGVASGLILVSPLSAWSRALAERFPIDFEHLGERYALLTLIVLGESFVKVLGALAAEDAGLGLHLRAATVLLVTAGLWWVYFDDVAGSHIRAGRAQWIVWLYGHLPLQISVVAVGVAVKKAVVFSWDAPAPAGYRWLLAGSLALCYASVAAIDSVTERRHAALGDRARINARWASAVMLLVLAPAAGTMSGGLFLTLCVAVNVAHVLFDLMIAPEVEAAHVEAGARKVADLARRDGARGPVRRRRDPSEAVRKGTPSELRRDLYFYLIEGSWTRVFVTLGIAFVFVNVFFAALYTLEPGSIRGGPQTFAEAFAFSVQTFATIGYGALTPATPYANAVVTVEAAVGLLSAALATGLVFAKVSRPRSSVLFSDVLVLTQLGGRPTLMLRAGNARGNEVIDASANVSVLIDEVSPEGQHLRRLHDLELVRGRTPMFLLTWTLMHVVDDRSPLAGVDWTRSGERLVSIVVTLMGHDGTYGQTIYARKVYQPEDVKAGHRFADVMSQLEDGRLMIDYARFHDVVPEGAQPEQDDDVARPDEG